MLLTNVNIDFSVPLGFWWREMSTTIFCYWCNDAMNEVSTFELHSFTPSHEIVRHHFSSFIFLWLQTLYSIDSCVISKHTSTRIDILEPKQNHGEKLEKWKQLFFAFIWNWLIETLNLIQTCLLAYIKQFAFKKKQSWIIIPRRVN